MHTLLDLRGSIPTFVEITNGKRHDVNVLDQILPEAGSFSVLDRGYLDFQRLHQFTRAGAFFVIRAKSGLRVRQRCSRGVEQSTGLRSDQTVRLTDFRAVPHYPDPLRRIHFYDVEHHHPLTFLTNNFDLPALTITQLFKARWKVELFFKWVKQHLRSKAFYGTSSNAVKTQLWIAISVYVLVAILKKRLDLHHSLYQILQVLSVTLFEKVPILQAFHDPTPPDQQPPFSNQLILIGL
jgi:hypothetical protein